MKERSFEEKIELLKDLGKNYGRSCSAEYFMEKYDITRRNVHQMIQLLRRRGVTIPTMRGGYTTATYDRAVQELIKEEAEKT